MQFISSPLLSSYDKNDIKQYKYNNLVRTVTIGMIEIDLTRLELRILCGLSDSLDIIMKFKISMKSTHLGD